MLLNDVDENIITKFNNNFFNLWKILIFNHKDFIIKSESL